MNLYYLPGACSLAPHIVLRELGLPFDLVRVGRDKKTQDGRDFLTINPYGYVPALELDDGEVMLEVGAILQYLGDLRPEAGLVPANGTRARYRLQSALAFNSTELHKLIGALFNPALGEDAKAAQVSRIRARLDVFARQWGDRRYVLGEDYTVVDAYQYVVLTWLKYFGIELKDWPALAEHWARVDARPAVQAARAAEA